MSGGVFTNDRVLFARAMREVGHSLAEIGDALGVSRERARQLIVGGQKVRGKTSQVGVQLGHDPVRIAQALQENGGRVPEAAAASGCSAVAVRRVAKALGIKMRRERITDENSARRRPELVEAMRLLGSRLGRTPTAREMGYHIGHPKTPNSAATLAHWHGRRFFGSWRAWVEAAGLRHYVNGERGRGQRYFTEPTRSPASSEVPHA